MYTLPSYSKEFLIFSVAQDLPMGMDNEPHRKNYYINMGEKQGLKEGTLLDVFRIISLLNPYDNKNRINYKVKIGELKVIHSDKESSITTVYKYRDDKEKPVFDLDQFMVGDAVAINVD